MERCSSLHGAVNSYIYKLENGSAQEIPTELKTLSPVKDGYALAYVASTKGNNYRSPVIINDNGDIVHRFPESYDMALSLLSS